MYTHDIKHGEIMTFIALFDLSIFYFFSSQEANIRAGQHRYNRNW